MNRITWLFLLCSCAGSVGAQVSTFDFGRFGSVRVYVPKGEPNSVALFISGDGGWSEGDTEMARLPSDMGAIVAGIDFAAAESAIASGSHRTSLWRIARAFADQGRPGVEPAEPRIDPQRHADHSTNCGHKSPKPSRPSVDQPLEHHANHR